MLAAGSIINNKITNRIYLKDFNIPTRFSIITNPLPSDHRRLLSPSANPALILPFAAVTSEEEIVT